MEKIYKLTIILFLILSMNQNISAQCPWPAGISLYGSGTAGTGCLPVTTGSQTCHFFDEYATFSGLTIGNTYTLEVVNTNTTTGGPFELGVYTSSTIGTLPLAFTTSATFPISVTFVATTTSIFAKDFKSGCIVVGNDCNTYYLTCNSCPGAPPTVSTTQPLTTSVASGSANNPVLYSTITGCPNAPVTSLNLTSGLTTSMTDVTNAKVYFTTTTTFSTATQFGSTISNPGTSFTVNGSQNLPANGVGYFWLTYDISVSAVNGNVVDGALTSADVNAGTITPTTSNPTGTRTIVTPIMNDECATATAFPIIPTDGNCVTLSNQSTAGATNSNVTPTGSCTSNSGTPNDVWFSFVASSTSLILQYTYVSGVTDIYTQVFSSACSPTMTSILCTDTDAGGTLNGLTIGNTYYIKMYAYFGGTTVQNVCLKTLPPPPANNDCLGAVSLTPSVDLTCAGVTSGTTLSATQSATTPTPTCGSTGINDDVWYSFMATQTSHIVTLSNVSGSTDMAFTVYSSSNNSCGGTFTQVVCSDPNSTTLTGLTIGNTYFVRVYTFTSTVSTTASFDICITTPPPPPVNDNCAGATTLTVNADANCAVTTSGTTVSATQSTGTAPTCNVAGINDDVWYSFTATGTTHILTITGATNTTAAQVYSGPCGALVAVSCSSTTSGSVTTTLSGLTATNVYYVRVYSTSSTVGTTTNYTICIGTPPPPPANDNSAGAIGLTVNPDFLCGTVTAGNTISATQSPEVAPTCSSTGINDDVWYSFMATGTDHRISFTGTSNTMVAALYSGTPGSLTFITGACASTTLNATGLTAGITYYIRAYTLSAVVTTFSAFNICVGTPPLPPVNDMCSGAITVPPAGPFPYLSPSSDNTSATNTNDPTNTCQANSNAGVWYSFTPNVTGSYIISSCQSDAPLSAISDNVLSVFSSTTGCTGPFTQVACDDDGCATLNLQGYLTTSLTAGTQYYILIYGYNTNRGNIQLSVAQANPPPANDECASAVNLTPTPGIFTNPGTQTSTGATQSAQAIACEVLDVVSTDVWYKFTTDSDGIPNEKIKITVTPLNNQDFDMQLSTGTCAALTEVVCAIAVGTGPEVLMFNEVGFNGGEIEVRDNTTYFLRVIDYDGIGGNFTISATGSTALPVNILSFDAKSLNNKTVQLTWNVAAEVDVKEYVVERSNDNRNWSAIGSVKAIQNSTYGFSDNSPVSGVNYYRLAVKDVNASVAYSDIRTVNFSGKGNMALYPNPANNTLYVSGTNDKNVVISIYNEVGQIVTAVSSNGETIRTGGIDVSQLLPGAYSIQVKGESGLTTMRFVKQ